VERKIVCLLACVSSGSKKHLFSILLMLVADRKSLVEPRVIEVESDVNFNLLIINS